MLLLRLLAKVYDYRVALQKRQGLQTQVIDANEARLSGKENKRGVCIGSTTGAHGNFYNTCYVISNQL